MPGQAVVKRCEDCGAPLGTGYPCASCGYEPLDFPWMKWTLRLAPIIGGVLAVRLAQMYAF
jgi:hypothetical protein